MFLVQQREHFVRVKEGYRPFHGNLPFMTKPVAGDIMCDRHCVRNNPCVMFVVTGMTSDGMKCELFHNQNMANLVVDHDSQIYTLQ